ncbi:MAG: protein translocase subunit SecF [Treponema sp.]|nr:protein translocase subunit SecF [Treponema sp.]MCL2251926.1 protein translocase subunit SecF [Treponema sp.]
MKKTIQFSKFFFPAAIISVVLVVFSITGYIIHKGFALGVDFQAGLLQEVQIAPSALNIRWNGTTSAVIQYDRNNVYIIISGSGIEGKTYKYSFAEYTTLGAIKRAMEAELNDIEVTLLINENNNSIWLVFSSQSNSNLSSVSPYVIHYLDPGASSPTDISEVRTAMSSFSQGVSVQNLGNQNDRQFMIRIEDKEEGRVTSNEIVQVLEAHFGKGTIAVLRSDYVGSRFSKNLTDQAGVLISLTLLLVLIYSAIRFKLQFAVGAVIAIMYDVLVIIAFVVWTRMEFTTLSIAAILTILGYSTNNTIILFDRIRENLRIYSDNAFVDILNISLTGILGRTIITTASTMLAVLALFIFTTGSMKDFALALLVGMISGVFTTLFIVSGFVNFWDKLKVKREKKKLAAKIAG